MHTKDMLAAALRKAGLDDLADKAATGYYHDYLSPLTFPEMQLAEDLSLAALSGNAEAIKLRQRVINGDFDATAAEAEEWAASDDGQAAMKGLLKP